MRNPVLDLSENKEAAGVYVCSACGCALFESSKKFNAGCGFPSFWLHKANNVKRNPLHTYNRSRIQLLCARCGAHLGHLFQNKYTPTGLRYCINHDALKFISCGKE